MKRTISALCLTVLLSVSTLAGDGVMWPDKTPPPPPPPIQQPDPLETLLMLFADTLAMLP